MIPVFLQIGILIPETIGREGVAMRKFNITGLCVPHMHYMVDISAKINEITQMVDEGLYFTINRARQYGKTTTLTLLGNRLKEKYVVPQLSFEGLGDYPFESEKNFCGKFADIFARSLVSIDYGEDNLDTWKTNRPETMDDLGVAITNFCKASPLPVLLTIDEVDKSSNNQVFLNFLGLLRNKYLLRSAGKDTTFHSVILAGVYDVKNLKRKITG